MVAGQQPSAEGDTIGLVVELLGIDLIKMVQFTLFQDLVWIAATPLTL